MVHTLTLCQVHLNLSATYWIIGIAWLQDEQLKEVHNMIEMEEEGCDVKFRNMFEQLQTGKLDDYSVAKSLVQIFAYLCDNLMVAATCISM